MVRSRDELMAMCQIEPVYKEEIEKFPMPPKGQGMALRANRANHLATLRQYYPIPGPLSDVAERDRQIEMRDGTLITIRIYTPKASLIPASGSLLYVAFHEGGWCFGDLTDEEMNCRMISKELGAVCINVDYRLAPEHPFPTGINDCWDTLKWAAKNAASLNANPKAGFIVGGASAGGNISAVLALLARDEQLDPPLTGQYLCVPAVLPPISLPEKYKDEYISWDENTNDPVLNLERGENPYESMKHILKMDLKSPLFNPAANPNGHANLPPAYFQICGMDPLRDEGLIYEKILREDSGVRTRLDLYPGYGHMFWTNFSQLEKSREFVRDTLNGIKWLTETSSH